MGGRLQLFRTTEIHSYVRSGNGDRHHVRCVRSERGEGILAWRRIGDSDWQHKSHDSTDVLPVVDGVSVLLGRYEDDLQKAYDKKVRELDT